MSKFVHLHVHSQYSLLDGQAAISAIVDKAMSDGMPGVAITDHGVMYGIKEFTNYVNKKNKGPLGEVKSLTKRLKAVEAGGTDEEGLGVIDLRNAIEAARAKVFIPIIGCEMYVANASNEERTDKRDTGRHLVVLAKNKTGYKNLIKIVSESWTKGFYHHPRTDKASIAAHKEGLIISSACLGGEIPQLLMNGDLEGADRAVKWWKDLMGDDYYLELQRHKTNKPGGNTETYERQKEIEPAIIELARRHNIKLIATNDSHFVNEEDAEAHDHLICISTKKDLNDENRMRYTKQEWFKSTTEMETLFSDMPEVISNTLDIIKKVEIYSIDHEPIMPNFAIPEDFGTEAEYRSRITEQELFDEFTRDEHGNVVLSQADAEAKIDKLGGYEKLYRIKFEADYLRKIAYEGAHRRYGAELSDDVIERIDFELHIMKTMGFPGYFLIVQDFIRAGREELGVSIGPGRGSAAGSVVAYCLGITQIDPLAYDLLFERFLNPDRISLPDIDVDFDDDGRAKVLKYVTEKYGEPNVAHIITYGTMAAKSAIKDVARVESLPIPESNRLAKLIPAHMPMKDGKELKPTLSNCYQYLDAFKAELEGPNPTVRSTLKYARQLEGNVRNTGVHACGVIICRDPVSDWVPVSTAEDKEEGKLLVTQYEGSVIEETGLIKMDFLGLKTLSIIKTAQENIKRHRGIWVDIDNISVDDKKTYELYSQGRTIGTFQFESAGMQKYLKELQPSKFEDLIAMNALYRPGPMDYIPDFIARKHGQSPIVYDIPIMERYLKDTYGVTVYQEQVMLLSRLLANFTRGQSDTLRKAMGKKLIDKMNALEELFYKGGQENGHDVKVLQKIWNDWKKFASYAFNKSHATCYSWVAYQTGYLKAHYPAEYMAAVLTHNRTDIAKLTGFMDECRAIGITVKGPDVNESVRDFGVTPHGDVRFGLSAISGIGDSVVEEIVKARGDEPFKDIYDFVERVPSTAINRRVFENLALAGAFDCFEGLKREDLVNDDTGRPGESVPEMLLRYGALHQNAQRQQQATLFDFDDEQLNNDARPPIPSALPWRQIVRLDKERDLIGMYLSAHPLDPYYLELTYGVTCPLSERENIEGGDGMEVTFGGMVTERTELTTRQGKPMLKVKVEDFSGSSEFVLFDESIRKFGLMLGEGQAVIINGVYRANYSGQVRFNITGVGLIDEYKGKMCRGITVSVTVDDCNEELLMDLTEPAGEGKSNDETLELPLTVNVYDPEIDRSVHLQASRNIKVNRNRLRRLREKEINFKIERTK
ncbi:MAG: DNA polymerase III subunit alpha [Odoribacter sp.]|nr:DNA polymerase III subunit alpha [Odoribacter sp.]